MALTRINGAVLATTGVSSGTYGGASQMHYVTVGTDGRVTAAGNVTPSIANTQITGLITSSQINTVANTQVTGLITTSQLTTTGVSSGTYGGATQIPYFTVGVDGRVSTAANVTLTIPPSTAVFANSGQLTANSSTGNVLLGLANTAVVAGSYTAVNITVDSYGRITAATSNTSVIANNAITQLSSLGVGTAANATAGTIVATNNITAYYSDERLKTKLGLITNALDKVKSLSGFYYVANETAQALGYEPVREIGVSAQEVQAILPEIVAPAPIDDKYLTVRYEKLVPLLIEAIKEMSEEIERLKAK